MAQLFEKPRQVSHIRTRDQGDELAIFNVLTAGYMVLNPTGKVIFEKCDGTRTIQTIAGELGTLCVNPPPEDMVLQDTLEVVEHMEEQGIVELVA